MADEDEDDREVDAEYDWAAMVAVDRAEQLVKNMSFTIDIGKLYRLEKTCMSNERNPYCPVLLRVSNPDLQAAYGGQYLVQVWSRSRKLVFQRVRPSTITSWNLVGNYFVFQEDRSALEAAERGSVDLGASADLGAFQGPGPGGAGPVSYMIVEIGADESIRQLRVKILPDV